MRDDLEYGAGAPRSRGARVQDRYSIRCAPHVIGVLLDALAMFRPILEIEVNSVNDNPIVDAERDEILHGGNFYGGHVAFAMDGLKTAVANVADLLDRQLALLCNPATSHGLPANLVAAGGGVARRPPRLQGDADHRLGADRRGAEADHARQRVQPQHRIAQPGQGQHGHRSRRATASACWS